MAGKHYGDDVIYSTNPPTTQCLPFGRINKAYAEGYEDKILANPNPHTLNSPAYLAYQRGYASIPIVERWEVARNFNEAS
jgi:hypothetical protein